MPLAGRAIVVGAGAFGREVLCWLEQSGVSGSMAFIDKAQDALNRATYPAEFLGTIEDYHPKAGDSLFMAIGDPDAKRRIGEMLTARGGQFATLIHPTAVIARTATIQEGAVVCPQALVSADAHVGRLVALNAMTSVGHDVVLGDYSTLSSHVDLTGGVQVGEGCFFGSGARVLPKVRIGTGARIGAGAVIMRNVRAGAVMYAPPARRL